jgi:hypothetical protein
MRDISHTGNEWQQISTAPVDGDLELAVIDHDGVHALAAHGLTLTMQAL